jgi:predicted dinucleotide-binding enzyme
MGSRSATNAKATAWVSKNGSNASQGIFEDAAKFGEILVLCTAGVGSMDALKAAGPENLDGKILIDISNPLDFSKGMPPALFVSNTDSLGEQIQRAYPKVKVVKTLNTTNAVIMANPRSLADGEHDLFMSGNDAEAKTRVTQLLKSEFGWKHVIDLGDITTARGSEMILAIWVRLYGALQTPNFNFHIVRA